MALRKIGAGDSIRETGFAAARRSIFFLLPFADRDLDPAEFALEQIVRPVAAGASDAGDAGDEVIPPVGELEEVTPVQIRGRP